MPTSTTTSSKTFQKAAALVAVALCAAASLSEAEAATRLCRQLQSQLQDLSRGGSDGSGDTRRYDRAIAAQRDQINKAERQARRAGCGGSFFSRWDSGCGQLIESLNRMERNLATLEDRRARMSPGRGDLRRERARLLASLDANNCSGNPGDVPPPITARERRGGGQLFEELFGGGVDSRDVRDDRERVRTEIRPGVDGMPATAAGTHRTLCVRTCDGYYFPISHASNPDDFSRDEQNCQAMCPGTEVKLFSHRVPDEESEAMVDQYDSPYTALPNAFKYRDATYSRPESCSCNPKRDFSIIAGEGQVPGAPADAAAPVVPAPRPDPAADPETQANREGSLDKTSTQRILAAKPGTIPLDAERKVRVVGPEFLPDPEAALDLRVPGQRTTQ